MLLLLIVTVPSSTRFTPIPVDSISFPEIKASPLTLTAKEFLGNNESPLASSPTLVPKASTVFAKIVPLSLILATIP